MSKRPRFLNLSTKSWPNLYETRVPFEAAGDDASDCQEQPPLEGSSATQITYNPTKKSLSYRRSLSPKPAVRHSPSSSAMTKLNIEGC